MNQILTDQITASIIQESINQKEEEMIERLAEIQQVAFRENAICSNGIR